ncbi:MAG TPA: cupredoxin domain-containing protein [Puia sp.]|nr:cupredoxin domain-containing protein [Puia sp.]
MKKTKLLSGILMIMLAGAMLVACSKSNSYNNGSTSSSSPTIYMKGSVYSNTNLQVATGTKVQWSNDDTTVHTVTADNGSFESGDIQPGGTFSQTFNTAGTFAYHDKHHASMTGVIVAVANKTY